MGVQMKVLDPSDEAPAAVAAHHTQGHFRDAVAIQKFAEGVDVLTVEIEHIDAEALQQAAEQRGIDAEPTPHTLRIIQDKFVQKQHFTRNSVPVADFLEVLDDVGARAAGDAFGYPLMLKSKRRVGTCHAVFGVACHFNLLFDCLDRWFNHLVLHNYFIGLHMWIGGLIGFIVTY